MKAQTEELLYFLLWTADGLLRPGWRNVSDSFEDWAWRNGLARRLAELERQKLIERHPKPDLERVIRLTTSGRVRALGGRDPAARWTRAWDGQWRTVLFDLPTARLDLRQQLWRTLRRAQFGYLQQSVWVSPDLTADVRAVLGTTKVQADAFLVLEGRPAAGETDADIVSAAWDFTVLNARYEQYLAVVAKNPPTDSRLPAWARRENTAWRFALDADPLLPRALLPAGYRGLEAYEARKHVFSRLAAIAEIP